MTRPTSVRWRILGLVVFASFAGYVLPSNLSIAGPAMIKDLGLSEVPHDQSACGFRTTEIRIDDGYCLE
jgi:hypothetical protein